MMMLRASILAGAFAFATGISHAADVEFDGYADLRLIAPPSTDAYLDGGLGKLRYGEDDISN